MNASVRNIGKDDNLPKPPYVTLDQLKLEFAHVENAVAGLETEADAFPAVIEDEEDQNAATALAGKMIKYAKRCEEIRNEQNRPHLDAQEVHNSFFKHGLIVRLNTAKARIEKLTAAYLKKKAAREQAARDELAAKARERAAAAAAELTAAVTSADVPAATVAVGKATSLAAFAARATVAASATTAELARTKTEAGTATLADNWTFDELDLDNVDLEALRPFLTKAAIEQAIRAFIKSGRREIAGARIFNDNRVQYHT